MSTFEEILKRDMKNVFFNTKEFAEVLILQFAPDEPFEVKGIFSKKEDSWKNPRVTPNDPKEERMSLQIIREPFKEFDFVQGSEVKVNETKYYIESIIEDKYTIDFTLTRKEQ